MRSIPRPLLTFFLVGIGIGVILVLQGKSGVPIQSDYPLDELEAQKAVVASFIEEQQNLEQTLTSLREKITEAEEKISQYQRASEKEKLETLTSKVGLSALSGPGISIFLADSLEVFRADTDPNADTLIHGADLRDITNLLFSSGAEAISLNGKRILPLSSVNFVGNTFLINDFHVFPPFNIQAIGEIDVLSARVKDPAFLPSLQKRSQSGKIRFYHSERDRIDIPEFEGKLNTGFLTLAP